MVNANRAAREVKGSRKERTTKTLSRTSGMAGHASRPLRHSTLLGTFIGFALFATHCLRTTCNNQVGTQFHAFIVEINWAGIQDGEQDGLVQGETRNARRVKAEFKLFIARPV